MLCVPVMRVRTHPGITAQASPTTLLLLLILGLFLVDFG